MWSEHQPGNTESLLTVSKTLGNMLRMTDCINVLTLHPLLLHSSNDSFQNLHAAEMEVTNKLALMDLIPGPTMGLTTR